MGRGIAVFEGVLTALITPFRDGGVDERAIHELVELQISAGVDGLVPCGSTGESATLSHPEHRRVIEVVVAAARAGASPSSRGPDPTPRARRSS
jgi:4-hydroxy-tetrahydrodipicolinate synthase